VNQSVSALKTDHATITFNFQTGMKAAPNFDELRNAIGACNLCSVIELSEGDINPSWL
jgi:hypothetical protein